MHVDLYKFHIDSAIKVNVFVLTVTGAIVSYVFSHQSNPDRPLKLALFLPCIMSTALAIVMAFATRIAERRKKELVHIELSLNLKNTISITLLQMITMSFCIVNMSLAIGMIVALIFLPFGI